MKPHLIPKPCKGGRYWLCKPSRDRALKHNGLVGGAGVTPREAYDRCMDYVAEELRRAPQVIAAAVEANNAVFRERQR